MKTLDLTGQQFGKLIVIGFVKYHNHASFWQCHCVCGNETIVRGPDLRGGKTKSCGCGAANQPTHGMSGHPAYNVWSSMLNRCNNPKAQAYKNYGGRGIKVCEAWHSFENFWTDMGSTWQRGLTLDRRNDDGHYNKANCRWITRKEQAFNKRNNVFVDTPIGKLSLV